MAKSKKKSVVSSENVHTKEKKKKLNPFEVHLNKEKIKVLGKKSKNDRGLPGVSRERALNKRKQTLLQEYKLQNKSNRFVDRRMGENDKSLTEEDKFVARYAKLRAKAHKKSIFNLTDEVLTHRGQTLSEIEKFDNPRSDDEDSLDNDTGKLESNFVEEAHFGGGFLSKVGPDGTRSHKDVIDQLIADSKKRKAEKQTLKEQNVELTEKLDSEWKDLLPLIGKSKKSEDVAEQKADDFDKVMRELKFEARGNPSDRLKSEDEIAKEEKEKLERLEQERLERMHGFTRNETAKKHVSADDLDDNFVYDDLEDEDVTLSYNTDGVANVAVNAEINGKPVGEEQEEDDEDDESTGGNDEEIDEEEESDEDNMSDLKDESEVSDEESENEEPIVKKAKVDENKSEASKEESETGEESESEEEEVVKAPIIEENDTPQANEDIKNDLLQRKQIMEKARQELPYTFAMPENDDALHSLLIKESPERQNIIIERIIKCNHQSLGAQNKENLGKLFVYLLQYLDNISSNANDEESISNLFKIFYNLLPHLFDLASLNSESTHVAVRELLSEKHMGYRRTCRRYPGVDILIYLKLVNHLFSTSDFKHAVVTPSFAFMDQMLNCCRVRNRRDIAYGLFLTTLISEYTALSKRFLPSAVNFLAGILYMCIPKAGVRVMKISAPFKINANHLLLFNNWSERDLEELKLPVGSLIEGPIEDEFKIKTFHLTLTLIGQFVTNIQSDYSSNCELLTNIEKYLDMIPLNNYPKKIRDVAESVKSQISNLKNNREIIYLVSAKPRPKALRLYEPTIQKIYDTKKHKSVSAEKAERDKLLYKLKKERKGALREIRRDNTFLASVKINKQIKSDKERKDKVRKLLAEASIQQSELNEMDRKRKRK